MSDEFFLPFGGKLNLNNRWVTLAQLIPWEKVEEEYIQSLKNKNQRQKGLLRPFGSRFTHHQRVRELER